MTKIKELMMYVGTIGAMISGLAYIIITVIMILGFEKEMELESQLIFSIIGAVVGIAIMSMLRTQGVTFASNEPESKATMQEYRKLLNLKKTQKKLKRIESFMIIQFIKDLFTKVLSILISTFGILYLVLEGNGDFSLIGLAIANLLMFTSFGLIALSRAYDFYINEHIPTIKELIKRMNERPLIKLNSEEFSPDEKEGQNANL